MFNAKGFINKAARRESIPSSNMKDLVAGLLAAGGQFGGYKFVHSNKWDKDYLILGTFDDQGLTVEGTDVVNIGLSAKLKLSGASSDEKFLEIYDNHPVFYGENPVMEGGIATGETRKWLTVAPVGTFEATPATAIDFASLIEGKQTRTAVAQ